MPDYDVRHIAELLLKYQRNEISASENIELQSWVGQSEQNEALFQRITNSDQYLAELQSDHLAQKRIFETLKERINKFSAPPVDSMQPISGVQSIRLPMRNWLAIAAAVLVLFSLGGYLYTNLSTSKTLVAKVPAASVKNDLLPGGNHAILTLSSGTKIILDSASDGILAKQGDVSVFKLANGKLAYNQGNESQQDIVYNTITTPRGGQYQIALPDGTKVWLNSSSSLRFPTYFSGPKREIELTGEAYLEVSKNPGMPFHVKIDQMEVQVLGTRFNVNAYSNEPNIKMSLLDGSVRVVSGSKSALLKPGQQAVLPSNSSNSTDSEIKVLDNVDLEEVVAWKNGIFQFDNTSLEAVMRELARWYDVDKVVYEGKMTTNKFSGQISREYNASDVLKILELSNVHFRIEGKSIIVMP